MCKALKINKTRTSSYSQCDAMIERLNRTIKDVLSKYISVNQTDWDKFIEHILKLKQKIFFSVLNFSSQNGAQIKTNQNILIFILRIIQIGHTFLRNQKAHESGKDYVRFYAFFCPPKLSVIKCFKTRWKIVRII